MENMEFPTYYKQLYSERLSEIQQRLSDFKKVEKSEWFYEACYCILTPQSKAIHADIVCSILKKDDFFLNGFHTELILGNREHYIRFHNQKSKNLQSLRDQFSEIESIIDMYKSSPFDLRDILCSRIKGFGLKESAHFMRNIGIFGPAILDRHILKHLAECNVIEQGTIIKSSKHYTHIEQLWLLYCSQVDIPMEEMDLLFWSIETGIILK
jgi:N-glycosylase/DNA lyase